MTDNAKAAAREALEEEFAAEAKALASTLEVKQKVAENRRVAAAKAARIVAAQRAAANLRKQPLRGTPRITANLYKGQLTRGGRKTRRTRR